MVAVVKQEPDSCNEVIDHILEAYRCDAASELDSVKLILARLKTAALLGGQPAGEQVGFRAGTFIGAPRPSKSTNTLRTKAS